MADHEIVKRAAKSMDATIADARHRFAAVRTGRASLAMFDGVSVDYYGTPTPLNQVAKLSIPEPTMIVAQPFDPSTLRSIERAILSADLGLNPSNDGKVIRIPIPPLTEERRKELVKKVHAMSEDSKTAIRHVRREANDDVKKAQKAGDLPEDAAHRLLDEIQKITDAHTSEVDELAKAKEQELMEV